eukprot:1419692-Amphidinium_carterae.1
MWRVCSIAHNGTRKGEKPACPHMRLWLLPVCGCMGCFLPLGLGSCRPMNQRWFLKLVSLLCGLMDQANTAVTPTFADVGLAMSLTL